MTNDAEPSQSPMFPKTRWSLVLRANGPHTLASQVALGELLNTYWQPLYVFARRSGLRAEDAQDAVQSFYEDLIRVKSLKAADTARGRLRSFLLGAFQNHLRTQHRDASRQKRGGNGVSFSMDDAEAALEVHLADNDTPDRAFDRRWAYAFLEHVLKRLRAEYEERGRGEVFAVLEPTLVWNSEAMSYEALAGKLGMSAVTVAQNVKRLRERYRRVLEEEIADTVDSPEAAAEEREHLIRVLAGG